MRKPTPYSDKQQNPHSYPTLEFHLRKALSEIYEFHLPLFSLENGQFRISYRELQNLVHTLNASDETLKFSTSELYGVGLLSLIYHKVIRLYRNQVNPDYISDITETMSRELGQKNLEDLLTGFLTALPSGSSKSAKGGIQNYLKQQTGPVPNVHVVVEELLIHLLALQNPAFERYQIVFKEEFHAGIRHSNKLLQSIKSWSMDSKGFGPEHKNIIDLLREPMRAAPNSIREQLVWIKTNWSAFLGSHLLDLLQGLDNFKEEYRFRGAGPGESAVPHYSGNLLEGEFYSADSDWMPKVVMIARNSLVWLDQLSKKYDREIRTLDAIPDTELDLLEEQGFTVLWLIGLWNRSRISKKIKHWCGNPDAESSAYSLKEYKIDPAIGGPEALADLRRRAWERGIRLASDMVPNHTGLDSDWLKHHPDWYISTDHAPFPSYTFTGGDLSEDPELSIHLEDHYYERSDAAVVFKHHDHRNGQTRYVYHGNDGTSMPWNDTAQLNYLNPELRESVIQTILDVARQFKVIRFDAAMTLAKRHIQRLWYPEPGSGGDIPSRSAFSMNGADFNAALPTEFWREVVDRVAREVPDTLLLAEAFWMMEGYFVRTLGMHRVYNSAFMNMLKLEENSKFFEMIANTLEFDPRILQRFVNFLSNPDEDTAIAQFGKGDKYFGATLLMITLPGLPMFAHAQIEGFQEKYGMEYRRAYWDETPDEELVKRHREQIFPLMKQRHLFSGAGNFRLFPMLNSQGNRVDSVFAYTNRYENETSLVIVNNAYSSHSGWIKKAVPFNIDPAADQPVIIHDTLISALAMDNDNMQYLIFQEQLSKLWFIRQLDVLRDQGLFLELSGYESQVYLNFQLVSDDDATPWDKILEKLQGRGVADFAHIQRSLELEPIQHLFSGLLKYLMQRSDRISGDHRLLPKFAPLFEAMLDITNVSLLVKEVEACTNQFAENFKNLLQVSKAAEIRDPEEMVIVCASLALAEQLRQADEIQDSCIVKRFDLDDCLKELSGPGSDPALPELICALEIANRSPIDLNKGLRSYFQELCSVEEVSHYLLINESDGVSWFNQERMECFLSYFTNLQADALPEKAINVLHSAFKNSKYQLAAFLDGLSMIQAILKSD